MTLKPPTKTFPKLVMKEWPEVSPEYIAGLRGMTMREIEERDMKILSDFTRVLEGVEGQKRSQKEKSRDE